MNTHKEEEMWLFHKSRISSPCQKRRMHFTKVRESHFPTSFHTSYSRKHVTMYINKNHPSATPKTVTKGKWKHSRKSGNLPDHSDTVTTDKISHTIHDTLPQIPSPSTQPLNHLTPYPPLPSLQNAAPASRKQNISQILHSK